MGWGVGFFFLFWGGGVVCISLYDCMNIYIFWGFLKSGGGG